MLASLGLLDNTDPDASADVFDEATELAVRHFQQRRGISVDGRVGAETYAALTGAHWRLGDRVLAHDRRAACSPATTSPRCRTSCSNSATTYAAPTASSARSPPTRCAPSSATTAWSPTAICGPRHVARAAPARPPGGRRASPVAARVGRRSPPPGRTCWASGSSSTPDTAARIPAYASTQGDRRGRLVWDLASRLEGRLRALGVHDLAHPRPAQRRHRRAAGRRSPTTSAPTWCSPCTSTDSSSPHANGLAAYYFGGGESSSTIGERLADLVQRELVARTGLLDGRIHGKTWALLRLTRMPAVRVEIGYLTSPVDRPRLADPLFRDTVAEGLLVAVQRLYLPTADDPPTGVLRHPRQLAR